MTLLKPFQSKAKQKHPIVSVVQSRTSSISSPSVVARSVETFDSSDDVTTVPVVVVCDVVATMVLLCDSIRRKRQLRVLFRSIEGKRADAGFVFFFWCRDHLDPETLNLRRKVLFATWQNEIPT
jgi:hypothetical protein